MDYVVGGVAALISGNVTPNRPKLVRRAITPIKHQPSPNVTPKSELVDDRSIFLSPSVQKKKAIVKKSPKRIFQNPDLDVTSDGDNKSSPKADKVKKHLHEDLEETNLNSSASAKSPKKNKSKSLDNSVKEEIVGPQSANENTPKKKKKRNSTTESNEDVEAGAKNRTSKGKKKRGLDLSLYTENQEVMENETNDNSTEDSTKVLESFENVEIETPKKKNKKKKVKSNYDNETEIEIKNNGEDIENKPKKSKKKNKISVSNQNDQLKFEVENKSKKSKKKDKKSTFVNPNAITNEDTDSEHESDDELLSENEEANKEILDTEPADESSDEETQEEKKVEAKEKLVEVQTEDEIKRTLFVGNVPFGKKCKKDIKRIFSKYGAIQTIRIRTVPVKDARVTPKLAVIKNELHPERTTVNVYVKFRDASSVEQALSENNTVLEGYHLRVSRSDATGAEHDPRNAVFVGNMPFALEDDALREKFDKCGQIVSVRIIRDKKTNAGKGFGYVNFASKDGVELALALSEEDLTIKNRIMRVKRCTQLTPRQQNHGDNKNFNQNQGRSQGMRSRNQGMQGRNQGMPGRNQGMQERNQGMQGRNQGMPGRNQGMQERNQGMQGRNQGMPGRNQGMQERNQGMQGRNQGMQGRNQGMQSRNQGMQGKFGGGPKQWGQKQGEMDEGAQRRIMNKRKRQENGDGPDEKKPKYLNESQKEKKVRKEFVGMTAEKKKKHTFNKGQKKKKALSEILTK